MGLDGTKDNIMYIFNCRPSELRRGDLSQVQKVRLGQAIHSHIDFHISCARLQDR